MTTHPTGGRTAVRRSLSLLTKAALAVGLLATVLVAGAAPAPAAVTHTLTVDTLAYVGDDVAPGNGVCLTAGGTCTLRAAIMEANALAAGPGDEVLINFNAGVSGFIVGPNGNNTTNRMKVGTIEPGYDVTGAYYHITGRTRIDFGDDVGFVQYWDEGTGFFIDGPDVVIENFNALGTNPPGTLGSRTATGITGGETAFIVSGNGDGFTLRNGAIIESGNNRMERGIILQNGANDVTIQDVRFDDFENLGGAMRISSAATVSNLLLDGVVMDNTNNEAWYYALQAPSNVTLNDFRVTDSHFNDWEATRMFYLNGATINGGSFDNNEIDTVNHAGAYLWGAEDATINDFSFHDNLWNRTGADRVIDLVDTTLTNVSIVDNTFQDFRNVAPTNARILNLIDGRYASATNLTISGNTFDNIETVGGWYIIDLRYGDSMVNLQVNDNVFNELDVTGSVLGLYATPTHGFDANDNTFTDVDMTDGFIDMRAAASSDVEVARNSFSEVSSTYPMVWTSLVSVGSSVHDNTWVNTGGAKEVGWVFVFDNGGIPAATNTGWTFRDNHIAVAPRNTEAPVRVDSGYLPVVRNTFAAPSRGTTPAEDSSASSETGVSWFVRNTGTNANGKLRTWYPNAVEIDNGTERARVTVQPPTAGETPHPALPVSVDVYYTPGAGGQRQADVYLGRIGGLTAQSTFDINCPGCTSGGYIRVQTIAPNGATTQYSRIFQAVAGTVPVAGLEIDLEDGDDVPLGSTLTGTGTAGNTITVVNTDNAEVLCVTTVTPAGTWSCTVDFATTQGDATIVAYETEPDTTPVDETDPVDADVVPAPVILGVSDGQEIAVGSAVTGSGTPGTTIEVVDADTDEVLCTTTVQPDGTWSCNVAFDATQGPATIVANEVGGPSSDDVDVTIVPAPVILNVGNGAEVPIGSTIGGTGNPGETVEVVNDDNDEVLCSATVQPDGTWSCEVDEATTVGAANLIATEVGGASSPAVAAVIVAAVVEPGEAIDDDQNFVLDTPYTFEPLANDTDPTGATFEIASLRLLDGLGDPQTTLVVPGEGTYEVNTTTGEVTFSPEAGFEGPTTPVTYTVDDSEGNTYEAQIVLAAAPVVGVSMFGPGALIALALGATILALVEARRRRTAQA